MQVLKFGGTSVASAENIRKSLAIVAAAAQQSPVVMVVSALGGTTDVLINAGRAAAAADPAYRETLAQLEQRHLTAAQELLADDDPQRAELFLSEHGPHMKPWARKEAAKYL